MKAWLVSDGHLDVTRRARDTTLGCRVSGVLPQVPPVSALPLDFFGRLPFLLTMHIPAALHGAEVSAVAQDGLWKFRTAFVCAFWSGGFYPANPGAVLNLLDGPVGCDPGYHVVWCRYRMLRRHMAFHSEVQELLCWCTWSGPHPPLTLMCSLSWVFMAS